MHWIEGWVNPEAGLERCEEVKMLDPTGTRTPTPLSPIPFSSVVNLSNDICCQKLNEYNDALKSKYAFRLSILACLLPLFA
jgi:hypothetical protein